MRRITTLLAGLGLLALSACAGDADPAAPPAPTPTAAPTTPTPSPTPTPPAMPEAAKAHTKAGAKAFVKYFWHVADFATQSLDEAPLSTLTADRCVGCERVIGLIGELRRKHGRMVGATTTITRMRVDDLSIAGELQTEVTFDVATPRQVLDFPGTEQDETYPPATTRAHFYLKRVSDGWRVVLWESA